MRAESRARLTADDVVVVVGGGVAGLALASSLARARDGTRGAADAPTCVVLERDGAASEDPRAVSWARHLVDGIRGYFAEVDPLSAERASADVDDESGGLLGACERGDADAAKEMLRDGNECVRWLMFGERRNTRDTAVHGAEARRRDAKTRRAKTRRRGEGAVRGREG